MKRQFAVLTAAALVTAMLSGCGTDDGGKTEITVDSVAAGYARYDVKESNRVTEGFGTQFDTLIVEAQNQITDEEWQIQVDALEEMNLQCVRIRFFPEMYERGNDNEDPNDFDCESPNVDFDSLEMRQLYRLLDVFERNGVRVDLSWYGCRTTFDSQDGLIDGSWLGGSYGEDGVRSWCVMPRLTDHPEEEFAESVAACLNYLINQKGYTCIYEYSLFPEPEGMVSDIAVYFEIANLVKQRLGEYGLADKILFSGPADYLNNAEKVEEKYLTKMRYDKVTSSVYCYNADSRNDVMLDFAKNYANVCDKYGVSWGIAESGTTNGITPVTNSDSHTYERAHFMARFLINMVNGGCTNIKYFVFSDCYYDGALNELGLFRFRHEGWKAKPVWYSWSLICRYTDNGSAVFPVTDTYGDADDTDVCITAFRLPDGAWTYLAANNADSSKKIALVNGRADRAERMNLYRMTAASLPEDGRLSVIAADSEVDVSNGVAYFTIPAKGFVVLSDKA